jgi:hypothetical protein
VPGLEFEFAEILDEIGGMEELCDGFLEPQSKVGFDELRSTLQQIRLHKTKAPSPWRISPRNAIRSKPSIGSYEPNDEGEHTIWAELSSVWEIACVPEKKKEFQIKKFTVVGIASTEVSLKYRENGTEHRIAHWKTELGGHDSPGCHFHFHVPSAGEEITRPIPVPRFPSIFVTPMTVLEFTLAEIFQQRWSGANGTERWRQIQRERFLKLLRWHEGAVRKSSRSPWTTLKTNKPEDGLFTRDEV